MGRLRRLRLAVNRTLLKRGFPRDWFLIPLAAVIGVLGGLVATGFNWMVETSAHFFFGTFSDQGPAWWTYGCLLGIPVAGGLSVGGLGWWFARDSAGPGIPRVIESLARQHGVMRLKDGVVKAVTSALTIGTGGSAGVEGPIIQIGSV
ncbi:MAG: chloride channel protein, partial [Phycisphaeraceae bacterium]|nr:chloride channel protein [Phycisphaeraceae bacterium]